MLARIALLLFYAFVDGGTAKPQYIQQIRAERVNSATLGQDIADRQMPVSRSPRTW